MDNQEPFVYDQEQIIDVPLQEFFYGLLQEQWDLGQKDNIRKFVVRAFNPQWAETMIIRCEGRIYKHETHETYENLLLDAFNKGKITKGEMVERFSVVKINTKMLKFTEVK